MSERSGHRPNPFMLAAAMALAGPAFLGAQRGVSTDDVERPLAFDPLALRRRPPRKERRRSGAGAHCGAKQAARYAKQGQGINYHYEQRMRWNVSTYPRVLKHQAKQRKDR